MMRGRRESPAPAAPRRRSPGWSVLALPLLVWAAVAIPAARAADPAPEAVAAPATEEPPGPFDDRELPAGWYASIETSKGDILVRLHPEQAPQGVAHFAGLARGTLPWQDVVTGEVHQGPYYDGQKVYRARAGHLFEAGDPGGSGDRAPQLFVPPEVNRPIGFSRGYRMGLTRAPLGQISGAKFFITVGAEPRLNFRHPCIGSVLDGKEVVFAISSVKTYDNGRPIEPVTIERIRVFDRGDPEPLAEPVPYKPSGARMRLKDRPADPR